MSGFPSIAEVELHHPACVGLQPRSPALWIGRRLNGESSPDPDAELRGDPLPPLRVWWHLPLGVLGAWVTLLLLLLLLGQPKNIPYLFKNPVTVFNTGAPSNFSVIFPILSPILTPGLSISMSII